MLNPNFLEPLQTHRLLSVEPPVPTKSCTRRWLIPSSDTAIYVPIVAISIVFELNGLQIRLFRPVRNCREIFPEIGKFLLPSNAPQF